MHAGARLERAAESALADGGLGRIAGRDDGIEMLRAEAELREPRAVVRAVLRRVGKHHDLAAFLAEAP